MTKIRVRIRAAELDSQEQRVWLAVALFLFAGILTSLTTPLVWQVFDWMGMRLGETRFVSQTSFVLFWIAPGMIVGGILALSPKPEAIVSTLENKYEK